MRHRFLTADVFTNRRFGGNQLAVFPDARAIPENELLPVTREFNFSETVFVYPPADPRHTRRVRIFTPGGEIPFAGHPTVGTAHVLAATGEIALAGPITDIVLEEGVGPVPVRIRGHGRAPTFCQLAVAKLPEETPPPVDAAAIADTLSLDAEDLVGGDHAPMAVSCGLPYLIVPLASGDAVRRARLRPDVWARTLKGSTSQEIMVVAQDGAAYDADLHARVFVPGLSVPEDPATGSACAALGGYLARRTPRGAATLCWTVAQGVEMGRRSHLEVEADKVDGAVTAVRVGGATVLVSEGTMEI
jgi:trans-2,3-dihydro-3-hydroxyanthranilate isomerase